MISRSRSGKCSTRSPHMMIKTPTWRCRDGRRIEIRKMTTDHLQHTLYMLMRQVRSETRDKGLDCFAYSGNGEMGEYYAHQEGDSLCALAEDPKYCFRELDDRIKMLMIHELSTRGVTFDNTRFYLPTEARTDLNKRYRVGNYLVTITKVKA